MLGEVVDGIVKDAVHFMRLTHILGILAPWKKPKGVDANLIVTAPQEHSN